MRLEQEIKKPHNYAMLNINQLIRPNIRKLKPYQSARSLMQGGAYIFLDANENPFGDGLNRYPDPYQKELKAAIGAFKGVAQERMVLGNGSDEIIDMLIRSTVEPGRDNVIVHEPGFSMYEVMANLQGGEVRKVRLNEAFQPELPAFLNKVDEHTKLAFFCTPNNPTGNRLDAEVIKAFAQQFNGLVVVDEAYIEFSMQESFTKHLDALPNLVVLQTFSKAWGMAGARLGAGFMQPEMVEVLNKVKPPYNVNKLTMAEALKRLEEPEQMQRDVEEIIEERKGIEESLKRAFAVRHVFPSDANFLLVQFKDAPPIMDYMEVIGIILRDRSNIPGCENCIRITIGSFEENFKLIKAVNKLDMYYESD